MRVTIRGKNLIITLALRTYVESKIIKPVERIMKGAGALPILDIQLERTTRHHQKGKVFRAAANFDVDGTMLRAEVEDADIYAACNILREELEREIKKWKTKSFTLEKRGARAAKRDLHFDPAARLPIKSRVRNEGN